MSICSKSSAHHLFHLSAILVHNIHLLPKKNTDESKNASPPQLRPFARLPLDSPQARRCSSAAHHLCLSCSSAAPACPWLLPPSTVAAQAAQPCQLTAKSKDELDPDDDGGAADPEGRAAVHLASSLAENRNRLLLLTTSLAVLVGYSCYPARPPLLPAPRGRGTSGAAAPARRARSPPSLRTS